MSPGWEVWIGLNDLFNVEGDWSYWITGQAVTFTNWTPGELF